MKWNKIDNQDQINNIKEESKEQMVMLFKHSTTCPISSMALNRLERSWQDDDAQVIKPYFLDLLKYRSISNEIADTFGVQHESPQVILIKEGEAVYNNSHMGINYSEIIDQAKS
ncbi:bacillithiol system redox-active protein YtxJ [Fulvivirga sediminis]|uniref:Bacillithiol system redox-active protein YtxJ n=1 Tax=Fulvivirga sediminis TaxID=2803949 RepID=A0A937F8N8_9BACT|nr:bacillithiol system redox-active protein YtxJ [Fulvivirga sediminis]MBL3657052.1 bacillithiol system redox-active protein YtxJ [Fulvivirga sediminis]